MNFLKNLLIPGVTILAMASGAAFAAESAADALAAALAHSDRSAEDAADDARRKPDQVLEFAGLQPGMSVFEMEAGDGYYTEILSRVVGSEGSVIMQNPEAFDEFVGEAVEERLAGNRLANVRLSKTNFDALDAEDGSIDMVTWILGPHELWFEPGGATLGDATASFAEIVRVLKPGGVFLAVDHDAAPDSGPEVGGTLHRIREGIINDYAEAAGLLMLRSSDLLRNPDDPLDNNVFDPSVRGMTSKFVNLYQK